MRYLEGKIKQLKIVASKNPKILICGNGALENLVRAMRKAEEYIQSKIREELNMQDEVNSLSVSDIDNMFQQICVESSDITDKLNELKYLVEDVGQDVRTDISSLKKRIKYCKNPMEKKKLQQELNALYKEQKRRKRNYEP